MILPGSKYGSVSASRDTRPGPRRTRRAGPLIRVHTRHLVDIGDWFLRELREGGQLYEHLALEKERVRRQAIALKRSMRDWKQDPRSELQLVARIPVAAYLRWAQVDPHFWDDLSNLKRLKRDDETAVVYDP